MKTFNKDVYKMLVLINLCISRENIYSLSEITHSLEKRDKSKLTVAEALCEFVSSDHSRKLNAL